jgi:hypothetical protein
MTLSAPEAGGMSDESRVFRVAPIWNWVFVIVGTMAVGLGAAISFISPGPVLDRMVGPLIIFGPFLAIFIYGAISCRAESLEFTSDEVIYHKLWGDLRFKRSDIVSVRTSPIVTLPPSIVVGLRSRKRPVTLPWYFCEYTTWIPMSTESALRNTAQGDGDK